MSGNDVATRKLAMPMVVAGFLAIVALAASIFSGNDPMTTLTRGAIAFAGGHIVTGLWYAVIGRHAEEESREQDTEAEASAQAATGEETATAGSEPDATAEQPPQAEAA